MQRNTTPQNEITALLRDYGRFDPHISAWVLPKKVIELIPNHNEIKMVTNLARFNINLTPIPADPV